MFKNIPHKRYDLVIYNNNALMVYDPCDRSSYNKVYELSLVSADEVIKFKLAEYAQEHRWSL